MASTNDKVPTISVWAANAWDAPSPSAAGKTYADVDEQDEEYDDEDGDDYILQRYVVDDEAGEEEQTASSEKLDGFDDNTAAVGEQSSFSEPTDVADIGTELKSEDLDETSLANGSHSVVVSSSPDLEIGSVQASSTVIVDFREPYESTGGWNSTIETANPNNATNHIPPADKQTSKTSIRPGNFYKSAPIKRLVHYLDKGLLLSFIFAIFHLIICMLLCGPTLFVVLVLFPASAVFRFAVNICLKKQHGCCDTLTGNGEFWLSRRSVSQCLMTISGGLSTEDVQNLVQTRLVSVVDQHSGRRLYPRFTDKLVRLKSGHAWTADANFEIANHVMEIPTSVRSEEELQDYVSQMSSKVLSLEKPLWEVHVLHMFGYDQDTLALFRCDPCLADGVTLLKILNRTVIDQRVNARQKYLYGPADYSFNIVRAVFVGE